MGGYLEELQRVTMGWRALTLVLSALLSLGQVC